MRTSNKLSCWFSGALIWACSASAMADGVSTFNDLASSLSKSGGEIMKVVMTVVTIAGILIVIKGIVHLKQNYTGTGQERHLPKAIASLIFGSALFVAVPLTHMIVSGLTNNDDAYNSWSVANGTGQSLVS